MPFYNEKLIETQRLFDNDTVGNACGSEAALK